ncbi:hypothetical protein [Streptomyces solicathayae]|uniref:HEAT repeat protein n=1 Tax=Streptomyces solicathayae TaxID=3081768 RepID=A0ABZ0M1N9_9ACTN|nr:hypothetical protein [Streptomyces sp. HUAS YS2]WOX25430.1 hypothetical protein R2D22_30240 [Streptomyces sp. HUAS YS2]
MTSERPGPTHHLHGDERLPHGSDAASTAGAGRAEDRVRLDSDVFHGSRAVALRHSPDELAAVALGHRDRHVRRLAARLLPELPGADAALERLLSSSDGLVRGTGVARLRAGDLVPHLTDPSPWVRGLAHQGLREADDDPHARLRALCADPAAATPSAVSGLAEQRDPADAPLLRNLTRHADGAVRARALGGLRLLGALADTELPPHADDPDPRVGAVVLRALRDDPEALRGLLGHRHARVRARALVLLSHRHGLGWDEALPHLADPAPEMARAARGALRYAAGEVPTERLIALTAPGEAPARRALAMELLEHDFAPAALLNALRLLDDPLPEVRTAARAQALRVVWDRDAAKGPHADEIRALAEANGERIATWRAEKRRRIRAARASEHRPPAPPLPHPAQWRGSGPVAGLSVAPCACSSPPAPCSSR